ncbi:hypothetical protein [Loktanella sp. M215]|uniref:hypothetical protein n=1 Tax=Loktanella sp. M215 TaxID=2675431 RepID=UPI001F35779E|nr:hypothetical protein [Loktanella sp. M215]MCF7702127.1 hypothetical protein [Loktanella sp. M215]
MKIKKTHTTQNLENHYVVTGLFGDDRDFGVYKAPRLSGVECLFFSNSDVIGEYAYAQGWRFIKTFHPVLTNDYLESSLQSKWVKYLQFLNESPIIEEFLELPKSVLYFDHKFNVTSEHVSNILKRSTDASLLIRKTPIAKKSVNVEIDAALPYERYARHMEPTKAFINNRLAQGDKIDVTICNTGLIHYRNLEVSRDLADRVYNTCQSLKQPECQIVWAMHAQAFDDKIDVIDWNDPLVGDIEWQNPNVYSANGVLTVAPRRREPGHGIVVGGFHRSGTSSVAGMLHNSGISAGIDLMKGTESNTKGFFESWGLVNMHDRLMNAKGVDWATSLEHKAPLSESDLTELRAYFNQRAEHSDGAWCMKDPRIGRYLFEWMRVAPEFKVLVLYRSPNASALSLQKRSLREFVRTRGTLELPKRFYEDPDLALRLWVEHNEAYIKLCQAYPEDCMVIGHAAIINGFDVLQAVSVKFGVDTPTQSGKDFLDSSLLSQPRPIYVVSADVRDRAIAVWDALCGMDVSLQNPSAAPQSIEDQLILDIDGKFARAELLEVFAKAALKELEERHNVAQERHNVAQEALNKLKAAHQSQKNEIVTLKKQIQDVRHEYTTSTSWRISAPIRIGGRLVRQLRKRP